MAEVVFKPMNKEAYAQTVKTVLDTAREIGIMIRADCGGRGICGKCLVKIVVIEGEITSPTSREISVLGLQKLSKGYRLACQARVAKGRAEIHVPPESLIQKYRSADTGLEKPIPLAPVVVSYKVTPPKPSLDDPRPDLERIVSELRKIGIDVSILETPLDVLRDLSELVRDADWNLDVVLWDKKILDIRPHEDSFKPMGLAIDIGTSRIVVHLVDLKTGETLAIDSTHNPQASYGADVISRLTYSIRSSENVMRLKMLVTDAVNMLIKRACERASVPLDWVYEAVVVGNTVMHHLFLGMKPKYLGLAPYTPILRGPLSTKAKDIGININNNGIIYIPPVVAGFVGSDAIADAIAVGVDECEKPCIMVDMGTNTEIIINTGEKIIAGSTPAGPAFEGAAMVFGMRAIEGAIDQVFIYSDELVNDYIVRYNVIGERKPVGICGSGYIDVIANLYRLGLLNKRGKFVRDVKSSRFVYRNGVLGFVIAKAEETSIGEDIIVDEKDIDNLLLAKAAVISGLRMLLHYTGLDVNNVERIYIAGSFGSYLNIENAITIGLLPNIPISRYVFAGNVAIVGAKAMLKSKELREKAAELAKSIDYVEIAAYPEYKKIFIDSLYLP